ncbi:MAG TPA: WG repeat-containing protein [Aggregatilineales bacterium]|nr:WG repeat-containing protein [Aggregatilineales bacterium]
MSMKWGYVDQKSRFIIAPQYDVAHPFSEGLAAVDVANKCGYIDKTGQMVIEPQFAEVPPFTYEPAKSYGPDFYEGLAA